MEYSIWVQGNPIPVSEEIYHTYWHGVRKERYFAESDIHNKVFSYDAMDTEDLNGSELFQDTTAPSLEQQVIHNFEKKCLEKALQQLNAPEQRLIIRLYYYNESLRKIANREQIPVTTLQYRHKKILSKLKEIMLNMKEE